MLKQFVILLLKNSLDDTLMSLEKLLLKLAEQCLKTGKRLRKVKCENKGSALEGVPSQLPGLLKAQRLGEKTARLGFDWPNVEGVTEKIIEELAELQETSIDSKEREEEFGDLLFTLVQWARHNKIDAEEAMRKACSKFIKRFTKVEQLADCSLTELSLDEKEVLWGS